MTTPSKATAAKKSTPAQVFDYSAIVVQDSARPTRTAGRTGAPIPAPLKSAVTDSWAARERRANGRQVGKGKTLPAVPGSEVKKVMAFLRRAGIELSVGVGMQVQDRQGNRITDLKTLNDRGTYRIVFAAQTPKAKKATPSTPTSK